MAASEARARGASPARGRTHHIHIQQEPDFIPSMTFRLNVAQELLQRANRTIDRLENPNSTDPSPNGAAGVTSNDVAGLPELSQVIQSAVNNAMQSMGSNEGPGGRSMNIEMSVQIGPNGQMIAQQTPAAAASESSIPIRGSSLSASTPAAAASESSIRIPIRGSPITASRSDITTSSSVAGSTGDTGSDQPQQRSAGNNRQPLQHPPLSSMADTMDELEQTETRFRPFRQRLYDLLRQDPEYPSDAERQANQVMISRVTSVMHTLR